MDQLNQVITAITSLVNSLGLFPFIAAGAVVAAAAALYRRLRR